MQVDVAGTVDRHIGPLHSVIMHGVSAFGSAANTRETAYNMRRQHATTTTCDDDNSPTCNDSDNDMRLWICRSAARPKHNLDKCGGDNSRAHSWARGARREELYGTWSEHCRPHRRLGAVHQARASAAAHCSAAKRKTPGKHRTATFATLRRARLLIGIACSATAQELHTRD